MTSDNERSTCNDCGRKLNQEELQCDECRDGYTDDCHVEIMELFDKAKRAAKREGYNEGIDKAISLIKNSGTICQNAGDRIGLEFYTKMRERLEGLRVK